MNTVHCERQLGGPVAEEWHTRLIRYEVVTGSVMFVMGMAFGGWAL